MKKVIIVLTVALVVVSLLPLSSLAVSTATVGYSLTSAIPIVGTATVTEQYANDTYIFPCELLSYVSFPIDRWINYYPTDWYYSYVLTLRFDDADFSGATGFKFYCVTAARNDTEPFIRVSVSDAVVSVNTNLYDDYEVYFNEVTVYAEDLELSDVTFFLDCYVGGLNADGVSGVSLPVSQLFVTYDADTSQRIFLDSINENTTAIYNNLTNAPESFTQAVEDAQAKLEEEKQLQEEIQNGFDNMPLPDADDFDDAEIVFEDMTLDFATFGDIEDLNGVTMLEVWETIWDWGVVKYVLLCLGALLITSKLAFV